MQLSTRFDSSSSLGTLAKLGYVQSKVKPSPSPHEELYAFRNSLQRAFEFFFGPERSEA